MIAYVERYNEYYEVVLTSDTSEVIEETRYSNTEYEAWRQSNTEYEVIEFDKRKQESPPQPAQSSPTPPASNESISPPSDPQDPEQLQEYQSQLSSANLFYSGMDQQSIQEQVESTEEPNRSIYPEDLDVGPLTSKDLLSDLKNLDKVKFSKNEGDRRFPERDKKTKNNRKASLDKSGLSGKEKQYSQSAENSGLLNSPLLEPVPDFKRCGGDVVYNGRNNQWIVLGRDRWGGYTTGYGPGEGDSQAGAIDIVVGRMSPHPRVKNRDGSEVRVGPIFNYTNHEGNQVCDASRIYISQKTDLDTNFKLVDGRIGNSVARAGIVLKSDGVRIIARDSGIKLVTQERRLMNSQGGKSSKAPSGIDIIAGNDDSNLQPMVLGNNLVEVLREYGETINQVVGTVTSIIENVAKLDVALATHFHPQAFPTGVPNIPSPSLAPVAVESITKLISLDTFSAYAEKFKLEKIEKQYLSAGAEQPVRSSFNNVN